MFDKNHNMVFIDHGFVKTLAGEDGEGWNKQMVGTLQYNPPEMMLSKPYKGTETDIFQLGVNIFLLLTRIPPWRYATKKDPYYSLIMEENLD